MRFIKHTPHGYHRPSRCCCCCRAAISQRPRVVQQILLIFRFASGFYIYTVQFWLSYAPGVLLYERLETNRYLIVFQAFFLFISLLLLLYLLHYRKALSSSSCALVSCSDNHIIDCYDRSVVVSYYIFIMCTRIYNIYESFVRCCIVTLLYKLVTAYYWL